VTELAEHPLHTWSGTYRYRAETIHRPRTVEELQSVIAGGGSLHTLGTRHSFNDIGDATQLISLAGLPGEPIINTENRTVTVPGRIRYGELAVFLQEAGWALSNMASLPHISIAGSVATATHGSGNRNPSLASAVKAMTLVSGTGDVVQLNEDSPDFPGAVVHLGALGVVTELTLAIEPTFNARQDVYQRLPWDALTGSFEEVMNSGSSVSAVTDFAGDTVLLLWVKTRIVNDEPGQMPKELFGATAATEQLHMTPGNDPLHCTPQLGEPGPWYERIPHFLLGYNPSTGAEIQSEYLLDRRHATDAINALRELGSVVASLARSAEIRTIAADQLWLSPAYGRDIFGIHFTWRPEAEAVTEALAMIEAALAPYEPRPHWAKVFGGPFDFEYLYPRLSDFRSLAERYDPRGVFRNPYLTRTVLGRRQRRLDFSGA
jgi:alditol oxidase